MNKEDQNQIATQVAADVTTDVMKQIADLPPTGKKAGWLALMKERLYQKALLLQARMMRQSQDWQLEGYVANPDDPKTAKRDSRGNVIQIRRYVGWDKGRYNVRKLQAIRREQTLAAVAGRTHFNDGTPIDQNKLIDLYMAA